MKFAAVVEGARELRERLDKLGLVGFCKTTGGKGLHVTVPLARGRKGDLDWPQAKAFAREVCRQMAADSPDRYLAQHGQGQARGPHLPGLFAQRPHLDGRRPPSRREPARARPYPCR